MSKNEELQELIIKMTKTLPLTIADAAGIVAAVYRGQEMPEILNDIKAMESRITKEIKRRQARWQKGCEDGMSETEKEYGIQDPDYQEGYYFGAHVKTRDQK